MSRPDHSTYREWLNLDADGTLGASERALLDEHLAACADCRVEIQGDGPPPVVTTIPAAGEAVMARRLRPQRLLAAGQVRCSIGPGVRVDLNVQRRGAGVEHQL